MLCDENKDFFDEFTVVLIFEILFNLVINAVRILFPKWKLSTDYYGKTLKYFTIWCFVLPGTAIIGFAALYGR